MSLKLALVSLVLLLGACSANPATGSVQVEVVLEPGLISTCVKVTARDGTAARETRAIALEGKTSPLRIGMTADGLTQPVTVQAFGYSDVDCTILSPGEVSETREAVFSSPPGTVTLTLRPAGGGGDGGADGGPDGGEVDGGADAGTDGGADAGLDVDLDGYPDSVDCNDTDPLINPGVVEMACADNIDQNCNGSVDCQETSCNGLPCPNSGTCGGGVCITLNEICTDRVDNNGDNLVDCADPDCTTGATCSDDNLCTTGDRCLAGSCQKTGDVACTTPPPQCHAAVGTCLPDAGAACQYSPMAGSCNDGFTCTDNDTCTNGTCAGAARVCNTPGNACLRALGTCQEPLGDCTYLPRDAGTGTCDDGMNCTINDTCDGTGGCTGTPVTCSAPSQCHATAGCNPSGTCLFNARTGPACDAGTGAGTCDSSFNCNLTAPSLFPFTPSNFTEGQLSADAGVAFNVPSSRTLDTDAPSLTVGTIPPFTIITQGGESTLLIRATSMFINSGATLTIIGSRPVIIAVTGDFQIDGTIRARNGSGPATCGNGGNGDNSGSGNGLGGGGGGGFGTDGGVGGDSGGSGGGAVGVANGLNTLVPLRGGCNGGNGTSNGGAGGGAIQVTASGTITIANTLAAPGRGGTGATGTTGNSGGGGGSGGAIFLEAATVSVTSSARITANGGSGGEGSGGNAGADGLDGNETSSNTTANGGDNSGSGGNGGVGAAGTSNAGAGGPGQANGDGGGGGGGGVGRIRFKGSTCSIAGSGRVISPPAAMSCP